MKTEDASELSRERLEREYQNIEDALQGGLVVTKASVAFSPTGKVAVFLTAQHEGVGTPTRITWLIGERENAEIVAEALLAVSGRVASGGEIQ